MITMRDEPWDDRNDPEMMRELLGFDDRFPVSLRLKQCQNSLQQADKSCSHDYELNLFFWHHQRISFGD